MVGLSLVCVLAMVPTPLEGVDWDDVLGPSQAKLPDPLPAVRWRTDLRTAMLEADSVGRPVFVTFRCLPCKQCADFDKDVLEGGPQLTPLLRQFVTVRLTDALDLDLNIFRVEGYQDLDLSWWGYFLSPGGRIYGVFGGRDEVSDTTRISEAALVNTMRRVLAHHYDPRRSSWDIDGPRPDRRAAPRKVLSLPGYQSWRDGRTEAAEENCLHCHQVAEILRQPKLDDKTFDPLRDLDMWPLPENVGLVLDRDDGLLVTRVEPGSAARRAGLEPGDVLAAAGNRRLFGQADFRGVLHRRADPAGSIEIRWLREDLVMSGTLQLAEGWRRTVLDWRTSVSGGNIGSGPGFSWPVKGPDAGSGRMSITPWFGKTPRRSVAWQAGLRPHHTIIAVDGENPDLFARSFLAWFRLRHEPGDTVLLTVRDGNQERTISYRLPER